MNLLAFDNYISENRNVDPIHLGAYYFIKSDKTNKQYQTLIFINSTA